MRPRVVYNSEEPRRDPARNASATVRTGIRERHVRNEASATEVMTLIGEAHASASVGPGNAQVRTREQAEEQQHRGSAQAVAGHFVPEVGRGGARGNETMGVLAQSNIPETFTSRKPNQRDIGRGASLQERASRCARAAEGFKPRSVYFP